MQESFDYYSDYEIVNLCKFTVNYGVNYKIFNLP